MEDVELLVKLLDGDTQNLLDQQTLLITSEAEAVFNFAPIASTASTLLLEVGKSFGVL